MDKFCPSIGYYEHFHRLAIEQVGTRYHYIADEETYKIEYSIHPFIIFCLCPYQEFWKDDNTSQKFKYPRNYCDLYPDSVSATSFSD